MKKIVHSFISWSDVNAAAIRTIIQEEGWLNVIAACEKTNPVDAKAVMILLDVETLISKISGTPANLNKSQGVTANGYIRIGYLERGTPKAEIYDFIATQNGSFISGYLVRDGDEISAQLRFEYNETETEIF